MKFKTNALLFSFLFLITNYSFSQVGMRPLTPQGSLNLSNGVLSPIAKDKKRIYGGFATVHGSIKDIPGNTFDRKGKRIGIGIDISQEARIWSFGFFKGKYEGNAKFEYYDYDESLDNKALVGQYSQKLSPTSIFSVRLSSETMEREYRYFFPEIREKYKTNVEHKFIDVSLGGSFQIDYTSIVGGWLLSPPVGNNENGDREGHGLILGFGLSYFKDNLNIGGNYFSNSENTTAGAGKENSYLFQGEYLFKPGMSIMLGYLRTNEEKCKKTSGYYVYILSQGKESKETYISFNYPIKEYQLTVEVSKLKTEFGAWGVGGEADANRADEGEFRAMGLTLNRTF